MDELVVIGNPLLDYTVEVSESVLASFGLNKGEVHLVEDTEWEDLRDECDRANITAGGSGANVATAYSKLGGEVSLFGCIGSDTQATLYTDSLAEDGVTDCLQRVDSPTGGAITFVTPDGDRTFVTFVGAAEEFSTEYIDEQKLRHASYVHIEGFQFETEQQRRAALRAIEQTDGTVSVDLCDARFIRENASSFTDILAEHADIICGNEDEANALPTDVHELAEVVAVTHGADGSTVTSEDATYTIPAFSANVENTNGAGDCYDAGLLYGLRLDWSVAKSALLGSFAAKHCVEAKGARPSTIPTQAFLNHDVVRDYDGI